MDENMFTVVIKSGTQVNPATSVLNPDMWTALTQTNWDGRDKTHSCFIASNENTCDLIYDPVQGANVFY